MNKSCFFSCYLISQTSLGLQCAQILMSEGHKLLGIISNHHETGTWAQQNSIPIIPTIAEFQELNPNKKFDYLFSIVNTKILSNSILQLPRFCAINYHDSLLPKYAGVNATSWAILNNEKVHGISWHKMEEAIDHGCILKQSTFPVKEDDTALSLNLECYVHALESFKKLIKDLPKDSDTTIQLGIEQDIRNRTYFARYQKPPNLGFIFLDDSAQNIERQFRALYFGEYQNTLTSFKVLIDDHIFIPTELKILSTQSDTEAGTIISITDENIQVSTTTQDIILTSFKTTYGQPITIQEIKQLTALGSKSSNRLQRLSTKTLEELHKLSCDLPYSEAFWANSILNSTPATLPFMHQTFNIDGKKDQKIKKKYTQIIIPTKQLLLHSERYNNIHDVMERNYSFTEVLLTAFVIYLNHIGNVSPFSLGFVSSFLQNLPKGLQLFFPRYVSLTFSIPANITISDLMSHIQNQVMAAEKNKAYFNDLLVRSPNIASSYTALPIVIKIEDEFQAKDKEIIKEDTKFDDALIFSINKTNKTCILEIEETLATCYLNDAARILIKHLPKHLEILVKQILENPDQTIDTLSLLTEQEKHQLLIEWNDTKHEYLEAHNKTITQLFEEQVERTPDNIAVVYEDQALTYNQLNEKANQLAHYLRSLGVGPDTLVAIAVERSLKMIIGLLGILKAGGAYVPLDPDYPEERIKFMLDDTGASIILTDTKVIDKLPATFAQCICLNEEWSNISTLSSANLVSVTLPHNLAYVIYTSGSTGNPKGVMVEHGSLMKSTQARLNYYTSPLTNFLLLSSIAFDSSIAGIFWSLVKGIYIILPKIKNNIDAHSIFEQMKKYQVNHLLCVPSFYKTLLMLQEEHRNIQSFLAITVAGEYCDDLLIAHHHKYFSCTSLFNEYGPTEASVWSSAVCLHDAKTQSRSNQTSIGRPISNTQIYILDTYMNPVPIGIAGEIYIGGAGLARGYLNRADLTAEKFVPNPFVTQNDGTESKTQEYLRLYRSGDLARYLPDGNIEFLGRIDDQVKIRGFRIELGEIESTLNNHLDV
ncbi:MAG: amino acid adenylation domain-containing protein, partial [Rickettsiaceae bacterium]|nr:amino acid adenylation domain-containing protein [Rickettsiaceae bacterium]